MAPVQRVPVKHIDIARDFSRVVGGRFRSHGPHSGQEFLQTILRPAFRSADIVVVALDGIQNISASFFEEAFGGLVREYGQEAIDRVRFDAIQREYLIQEIHTWMREALENSRAKRR